MPSRTRALILGLATMVLLLGAVASAAAETYTVTRTDDPYPAPCEATNCSLRGALTAANATASVDDVVVLPASAAAYLIQYEMLSLPISDEVEVRGAGADRTVVKGDGEEIVFTIDAKSTLSGLTITGGKGGIQNGSDLTLRAVSVEGNERADAGGGIQTNGPLTIESSFLGANKTSGISGGAIQANAEVRVVNSTIAGNSSMGASAINGNDSVLIADSAVVGNRSGGTASVAVRGSPLTVSNSIFFDNRDAEGPSGCTSLPALTSLGGNVSDVATCGNGPDDKPGVDPLLGTLALHGGTNGSTTCPRQARRSMRPSANARRSTSGASSAHSWRPATAGRSSTSRRRRFRPPPTSQCGCAWRRENSLSAAGTSSASG